MEISSGPFSTCSAETRKLYQEWFDLADSDGDGRITGNDAILFFGMSQLPREVLKQVWALADANRQGFLGLKEFINAMQLVSLAQSGHIINQDLLSAELDWENIQPPSMQGLDGKIANRKSKPESDTLNGSKTLQPSRSSYWFTPSRSSKKLEFW